jgi:membrane protein YdbS with pleckstrin-like domain
LRHPAALAFLAAMHDPAADRQIQAIERPDRALWTYYLLSCLVFPPLLLIAGPYYYFRYHTMRYKFTDDGISMSWGILFRREIIVNYARIQDIHLKSNLVERWLGLARILVQTASGSGSAEMTIEGIKEFELLRDFLYSRMRGVKDHPAHAAPAGTLAAAPALPAGVSTQADLAAALRETAAELRALREELGRRRA